MDRLACIDLPAFPLQLHLKEYPAHRRSPTVIVDRDSPQGRVLWANEYARRARIAPGTRYATAVSIVPHLQAATVSQRLIEKSTKEMKDLLYGFSPEIEASKDFSGTFWLNASGLAYLYPSLRHWAAAIRTQLGHKGFSANVVVGFSRFGTYALTRCGRTLRVFDDAAKERTSLYAVKLDRLDLEPGVRNSLHLLGIATVGDFLRLPAAGLRDRFGPQVLRLRELAAGEGWTPFQADLLEPALAERVILDHTFTNTTKLVFLVKAILERLLERLAHRSQAVCEITLGLTLERAPGQKTSAHHDECFRPAEPTLDLRVLVDLLRLRLETLDLPRGVIEFRVQAVATSATIEQLQLFRENPRRDLRSAERALARIRAEFGRESVVIAALRPRHLPEASFEWRPIDRLSPAEPHKVRRPTLLRRIRQTPRPLPRQSSAVRNDGWLLHNLDQGNVVHSLGPYVVSGGWWIHPVHREYHYIEIENGDWLWVYFDRRRRRWFLHGTVE